ncbi:histidine kinase [Nakamurella sp. PAMC28650]|uniref:histidine kinase n=1 Tax=Nakamurella sp. PAMC28650 TaxID=2762325 RepID=UPI00164E78EB|nr:histidine kinase [Nakamurella sp. PAMC28650]QNK81927.1 PAS domain-containing protein [Nakamurella sp. PAMC28650]
MAAHEDITEPDSPFADAARSGLTTLAGVVDGAKDGIAVIDADRRVLYANPWACQMLGRSLGQLRGTDVLDSFPTREHAAILGRVAAPRSDRANTFTGVLLGADGTEREIVCSTFTIEVEARACDVVVFSDLTDPRSAARTAAALAQTPALLTGTASTADILTRIARNAVEGTRALACGISVMDEEHRVTTRGGFALADPNYGKASPVWAPLSDAPFEHLVKAMTAGAIVFGEVPVPPVVVSDARARWQAIPVMRDFASSLVRFDWQAAIIVPLSWQNRTFGLVTVFLPAGLNRPDEAELAFYTALADQAAVAVMNARLVEQAGRVAAGQERGRLARDLHDSVSQGLFAMTMQARASQLSMARIGLGHDTALGRSIGQLAELTDGALAEMRALIFELRPGALAEEGLIGALRKQGAALAARDALTIAVHGPAERLQLDPAVEEHLYRIVSEALHNVAKHAQAQCAAVNVTLTAGLLRVTVRDDGDGFDPEVRLVGHLGLSNMCQRAEAIGARFAVTSAPGRGTTVTLSIAYP